MSNTAQILTIQWDSEHSYPFVVMEQARGMFIENKGRPYQYRYKAVYRGYFDTYAPPGLDAGIIYWLKEIQVQESCPFPQLREQYDLAIFPQKTAPHIRRPLAVNPLAESASELLRNGQMPPARDGYFMVERPYSEITHDQIQYMTPWERLEYIDQYCTALNELYQNSPAVFGHTVEAHRDVKFGNGLILREQNRFAVMLLDFSSIRFSTDPLRIPVAPELPPVIFDGGQGTKSFLMSEDNTCLEIVSDKYPTTSATDVYALGTMLASLFGYITASRRNPNSPVCDIPDSHDKRQVLEQCLLDWMPWDKELGSDDSGITWLEHYLSLNKTPFHWGDPAGAPYTLDSGLLEQIHTLFFQATRIDPNDRIAFRDFHNAIHKLKNRLPKQTSNHPTLYLQPETICLFHQPSLGQYKAELEQAAVKAMAAEGSRYPVRLGWYQNPGDRCYSDALPPNWPETVDSSAELADQLRRRPAQEPLCCISLIQMMYQLWAMYYKHQYEVTFSGTIHIFSGVPFTKEAFTPYPSAENGYTFQNFLSYLAALSQGELTIRFHCPTEPEYREDDPSFVWVPMELSKPGSDPVSRYPSTHQSPQIPEVKFQPEAQPQPEPEPVDRFYLMNSEALFFHDSDGKKVFVSRKKIRG